MRSLILAATTLALAFGSSAAYADDPPPASESRTDPGDLQRGWSIGMGALGIVMLGFGTYYGFHSKSVYDDANTPANCPKGPTSCTAAAARDGVEARDQADASTVLFVAGSVLTAGGILFYLIAPKKNDAVKVGVAGTGIRLSGSF